MDLPVSVPTAPRLAEPRAVATLDLRPAACQGVPTAKDAGRMLPHADVASLAR